MRNDLEATWEKLKEWLTKQEANEIANFCSKDTVEWPGGPKSPFWPPYMELLCNAVLEIKYLMSGIETARVKVHGEGTSDDVDPVYESVAGADAYRRCIVGTVALSTIYGDHCKLTEVVEKIEKEIMVKVRKKHGDQKVRFNNCEGMDLNALLLGKSVLHNTIKEWVSGDRGKGWQGKWRVGGQLWSRMIQRCYKGNRAVGKPDHEATRKENLQKNKDSMVSFSRMKENDNTQNNIGGANMGDILTGDQFILEQDKLDSIFSNLTLDEDGKIDVSSLTQKIKDATKEKLTQECMKDSSKEFCVRLECAQQHWNLTKEKSNTGVLT
ncbi:SICAvar, type I (fragment) [Plasmodium knowlesi strain H]|uniref:SICAvar, type I n=2 Tax=Plasmodium knowlesi (strain H) TaxID=5851 RepID=A0A1A7VPZ3_PLAKH